MLDLQALSFEIKVVLIVASEQSDVAEDGKLCTMVNANTVIVYYFYLLSIMLLTKEETWKLKIELYGWWIFLLCCGVLLVLGLFLFACFLFVCLFVVGGDGG